MKVLFILLLLSVVAFMPARADPPPLNAALFIDGFLKGALQDDSIRVDECLSDADEIISAIGGIIVNLEGGFDLLSLIRDIGRLMTVVPNSLDECKNLPPSIGDTFKQWLKTIKNPVKIGKIVRFPHIDNFTLFNRLPKLSPSTAKI